MRPIRSRTAVTLIGASCALAVALAGGSATAQEPTASASPDTPPSASPGTSESTPSSARVSFTADIIEGTCERPAGVLFPLGQVSPELIVHGEPASGELVGVPEDATVLLNVTFVAATLDELIGMPHALLVSDEAGTDEPGEVGDPIACGDVGGAVIENDGLIIRLDAVDGSDYLGFGFLQQRDSDDTTTVHTILTERGEGDAEPAGSPRPAPSAAPSPATSPSSAASGSPAPSATPAPSASPSTVSGQATDEPALTVTVSIEEPDAPRVTVRVEVASEAETEPTGSPAP